MTTLILASPRDIQDGIAERLKQRRIAENLTQKELAAKAGISYSAIRNFERTAEGSFEALIKVAFALGAETEFETLFPAPVALTLADFVDKPKRQRVRNK